MNPNAEQKTVELITEQATKESSKKAVKPEVEMTEIQADESHPIEPSVDWTESSKAVDEVINESSKGAKATLLLVFIEWNQSKGNIKQGSCNEGECEWLPGILLISTPFLPLFWVSRLFCWLVVISKTINSVFPWT